MALTGTLINQNLPYTWNGGNGSWAVGSAGWDAGNWVNGKDAQVTNGGTLTIGSGVVAGTVTASGSSDILFQGSPLAASAILKSGSGKLGLAVVGTYTNGITISGGTVEATVDSALNGNVTLNGGATLAVGTTLNSISNLVVTDGSITGSGAITPAVVTVSSSAGSNNAISAAITGATSFTKAGAGATTLSGNNSYTGDTVISAGTLATSGDERIPDGSVLKFSASNTTNRLGGNETVRGLDASTTISSVLLDIQGFNLTVGSGSTSNSFSGSITGSGNVTKVGTGIQSWDSMHTFTGSMTIQDGSIRMQGSGSRITNGGVVTINSNAFGRGTLVIEGGRIYSSSTNTSSTGLRTIYNKVNINGNFALGLSNSTVGQTHEIAVSTNVTDANTTLLKNATLTVDSAVTWQQNIAGAGFGLTKTGPSQLALGGNNSFGSLTVSQGAVVLSGANTINSFAVNAGATLIMSNSSALGGGSLALVGSSGSPASFADAQPSLTLALGGLTLGGFSSFVMDGRKSVSSSGPIILSGSGNTMTLTGTQISDGLYSILAGSSIDTTSLQPGGFAVTGAAVMNANIVLDGDPVTVGRNTYTLTSAGSSVQLEIFGQPYNLIWGSGDSTWDTTTANWTDWAGDPIGFVENDNVTFTNGASVSVQGAGIKAGNIVVDNATGTVTFRDGNLTALSLLKRGAGGASVENSLLLSKGISLQEGSLALSASNAISDGVTNNGGLLTVNHIDALGTNSLYLNGGTLSAGIPEIRNGITIGISGGSVTNNANLQLSGSINPGGNILSKRGTGDMNFSGQVGASGNYLSLNLVEGQAVLTGSLPKYFTNSTIHGTLILSNSVINTRGSDFVGNGQIHVFGNSSWSNITSSGYVSNPVVLQPGSTLISSNSGTMTLLGGVIGTGNVTTYGSSGLYISGQTFAGTISNNGTGDLRFYDAEMGGVTLIGGSSTGALWFSNSTANRVVGSKITGSQVLSIRGTAMTTFINLANDFTNQISISGTSSSNATAKFVGTGSMGAVNGGAISLGYSNTLHLDAVLSQRNLGISTNGGSVHVDGDSTLGSLTNNNSGGLPLVKKGAGKLTFTGLVRDSASSNAPILSIQAGRIVLGASVSTSQYFGITNAENLYVGDLEISTSNQLSVQGSGVMGGGGRIDFGGEDASLQTSSTAANNGAVLALANDVYLLGGAGTKANIAATTSNTLSLNKVKGTGNLYFGTQGAGGGGGEIRLADELSFTGNVHMNLASTGVVRMQAPNLFASGQGLVMNRGGSGILDLNGNPQTLGHLQSLSNNPVYTGVITSGVAASLTVNQSANTVFGGSLVGNLSLIKSGSGALTLTGSNNYTGITMVVGGSLVIAQANFSATLTPSTLTVTLSNPPVAGQVYQILPGALSGTYGAPTVNNLGIGQDFTFDASTGLLAITQANNGTSFADAYPGRNLDDVAPNGLTYLVNYAFGGNSTNAASLPVQDTTDSAKLRLVAYVRTNNMDGPIGVKGQSGNSLSGWDPNLIDGVPADDNIGAPEGTQKQIFSVDAVGDQKFLRLKVTK